VLKNLEKENEILQKNLDFFKEKYPALETALTTTETQLYDTKSRLETTEIELGATKVELGTTKVELGTTKVELGTTKVELENTRAKLDDLILEYERAIAALLQAQRERFGRKTERFVDTENQQLSLFDDPQLTDESSESSEPPESSEVAPEDVEEITYTRKRTKNGTVEIPTREEIIAVPESERTCSCCGHEKDVIGYEESTRLDYKPAIFERVVRKREKMACRYGCGQVVVAVAPSQILPKCRVTESMLAYISVSKVLDRQPLYHLEKSINQRYQWHISRTTMARWMIQLSETLQPLVNLMKDEIEGYDVAAIDATTIQVLKEPGRSPETKSYAYCIRGGPPGKSVILYEYNAYRQGEYVESEGLPDFRGVIHCDASAVFNQIGRRDGVTLSYCHAHARRKFEQIVKASGKGKAKLATEAMQFYRRLYAIERSAK